MQAVFNSPLAPPGVSRATLAADAPDLLGLLDEIPSLLVYTRSSPDFYSVYHLFNTAVSAQPLAVVRAQTEDEVAAVVRFCKGATISLTVRVGGHDLFGRTLADNGVMLDLRSMHGVSIAQDRQSARIQGGSLSRTVLAGLKPEGLTTPTGFCNTVGYVGWSTGAGYGTLHGKYGLGVDQMLGARVVTPAAGVVDTDDDPELLWALRGAGMGAFGVVTELRIKTYPMPKFLAGLIGFSMSEAEKVLSGLAELFVTDFPDEFSGDFRVMCTPDGQQLLNIQFTWAQDGDDLTKAEGYLRKVRGLGTVVMEKVAEKATPVEFAAQLEAFLVPKACYFRTQTVERLTPELARVFGAHPPPLPTCHSLIHNVHGAALRGNAGDSMAFSRRSPHFVIGINGGVSTGTLPTDPDFLTASRWADELADAIAEAGLALDQGYISFMRPEDVDITRQFDEETLARLRKLKQKYDGGNLFSRTSTRFD